MMTDVKWGQMTRVTRTEGFPGTQDFQCYNQKVESKLGWLVTIDRELFVVESSLDHGRLFISILGLSVPGAPPTVAASKTVSRYCQMSLKGRGWGVKSISAVNHCSRPFVGKIRL